MGPSLDFTVRRTRYASDDLAKLAGKTPKQLKPKKEKNMTQTPLGETLGRLHLEKQEIATIQTRKIKGLKKRKEAPVLLADGSKNDGGRKKPRVEGKKGRRRALDDHADL